MLSPREQQSLFTLLDLSLRQTIDGLQATLKTIEQYKRGEVRLPDKQERLVATAENIYHQ